MNWFTHNGSRQEGPFSVDELKTKIADHSVTKETHVWASGMPAWKKITEVPELAALLASTPAPTTPALPTTPSAKSPQVDELSVFIELPKTASEAPQELPKAHAGQFRKEAIKAQKVATRTEKMKTSRHWLPRVALALGLVCVALIGAIAFLNFNKRELDPIAGISDADFARLKTVVTTGADSQPPRAELAASNDDPVHPRMHIASNLPNGTRFNVTFHPVPGTLIRPVTQVQALVTLPQKRFHAVTDRFELPRGEYQVDVTVVGDNKILTTGKFFLGGVKDAEYETLLTQERAARKQKGEAEMLSIREAVTVLSSFQEILVVMSGEIAPGKQTDRKKIEDAQKQWDDFEASLPQKSIVWQGTPANEFVLAKLVQLARESWQHARQTDHLFKEYFAAPASADKSKLQDGINSELSQFRDAFVVLKAEIDKTHVQEL